MNISEIIKDARTIAISGHVKADGDCIGACLALYEYINVNHPGLTVDVYLEDVSSRYSFIKGFEKIKSLNDSVLKYDLFFAVDCSTKERLGSAEVYFDSADHTVCIDHHISNTGYADENYIYAGKSSASEALFSFFDEDLINKDIAECLYVGIINDTGVFKYSCTTPETMRVAAKLMEYGLDTNFLIDESFYAKDYKENRILGHCIEKSRLAADGQVIFSFLDLKEMEEYQVSSIELDGIVEQLKLTRGVRCAVFIYECEDGTCKVSFRSNDTFEVNGIAAFFGGGGHLRAAGCNVKSDLYVCVETVVSEVIKRLVTSGV